MVPGAQCVITFGVFQMPELSVCSWDCQVQVNFITLFGSCKAFKGNKSYNGGSDSEVLSK